MAGAGLKTFTAGEVLTASDVNTYLAQQTVQVYAGTSARSSAVPTPSEGMVSYLSDINIVESYDGANWNPIDSTINVRTAGTAAYTLAAGDAGDLLQFNGTFTVTVPADSTYTFPIGTQINILNVGSGTITTAGAGGVTLNGTPGLKLRAQYSSATFIKLASDSWVIIGDLAA